MDAHCSGCGKVLAQNEILYTASGDPICAACNDKAEVAKGLGVSRAAVENPTAMRNLAEARGEYEFDANENAVIKSLALPMKFVAAMSLLFGTLRLVLGLRVLMASNSGIALIPVIEGALLMLVGSWLWPAQRALLDVVETQGADVTNLMTALKKLRNVYMLQAILWGLLVMLIIFGLML